MAWVVDWCLAAGTWGRIWTMRQLRNVSDQPFGNLQDSHPNWLRAFRGRRLQSQALFDVQNGGETVCEGQQRCCL